MITDQPINDAQDEMNRLDATRDEYEMHSCYVCLEDFYMIAPSLFKGHYYCPQCLKETN